MLFYSLSLSRSICYLAGESMRVRSRFVFKIVSLANATFFSSFALFISLLPTYFRAWYIHVTEIVLLVNFFLSFFSSEINKI